MVRPTVTIELQGGLGNQLFQIATAYAYAKKFDANLEFPAFWPAAPGRAPVWQGYFQDPPFNLISWGEFQMMRRISCEQSELGFAWNPLPPPPDGMVNILLNGYFQSSLYFREYESEVRALLQVPRALLGRADSVLESQRIMGTDGWIAAHVRRGDYLDPNRDGFHQVTTPEYFKGARSYIESKLGSKRSVCWITEDPNWVYKNLYQEGDKVFCNETFTDFALLASFQHLILSNSSFSWWATWLNPYQFKGRHICVPSKWFGVKGPQEYETIYESDWTRIDPTSGNVSTQL